MVEADLVGPRERPERVVHAELHAVVDVGGGADALADRERALVDDLGDDAAEDEARRVGDPRRSAARGPSKKPRCARGDSAVAAVRVSSTIADGRQRVEAGGGAALVERLQRALGARAARAARPAAAARPRRPARTRGSATAPRRRPRRRPSQPASSASARSSSAIGRKPLMTTGPPTPAGTPGFGGSGSSAGAAAVVIGVPALTGLAPEAPGVDHLRAQRRRAPARLAEAQLVERLGDLEADVDPYEVLQLERPHPEAGGAARSRRSSRRRRSAPAAAAAPRARTGGCSG